jgi:hypothetical protein
MIAINIVFMSLIAIAIVSLLSWAVVSDRRSHRTAGGEAPPTPAPLHRNLVMPEELRSRPHWTRRSRAHRANDGSRVYRGGHSLGSSPTS